MAKTTPAKKRRVLSKRNRILEGHERKNSDPAKAIEFCISQVIRPFYE